MESNESVKANKKPNKGGLRRKIQRMRSKVLATFYGNPARQMKVICIAGCAGEAAVAHLVYEILKAAGQRVAVLASDEQIKAGTLHKFLKDALRAEANYAVVTASPVSLDTQVFYGLPMSVTAVMDYEPTVAKREFGMDENTLWAAEKSLFENHPEVAVVNTYYVKLAQLAGARDTVGYGAEPTATVRIDNYKLYKRGVEANLAVSATRFTVASFLTGYESVGYMTCAAAIATALGFRSDVIVEGIANYEP